MEPPTPREVILRKVDAGALPMKVPAKMFVAYGSSAPCDACGNAILPAQVQYEWSYLDQPNIYRMHLACVVLWEAACRKRGGPVP
jgi:hypothetical protein